MKSVGGDCTATMCRYDVVGVGGFRLLHMTSRYRAVDVYIETGESYGEAARL